MTKHAPEQKTVTSTNNTQVTRTQTRKAAQIQLDAYTRAVRTRSTLNSAGMQANNDKDGGGKVCRSTDIQPARATSTSMQEHVDNLRRMQKSTTPGSWQDGSVKAMPDRIHGNNRLAQMIDVKLDAVVDTLYTVADIDNGIERIDTDVDEHNNTTTVAPDSTNRTEVDIARNTMTDSCLDFDKAINDR